jgi:uroporphyrin-3 C-methyltransferase
MQPCLQQSTRGDKIKRPYNRFTTRIAFHIYMNDKETSGEAPSDKKPGTPPDAANEKKNRRSRGRGSTATLALLVSLLSLLASGSIAWFLFVVHPSLFHADLPGTVASLQDSVAVLKDNSASARDDIRQLKNDQKTLNQALRKASESLGSNRRQWVLAEAEQLMIIANQRLQLAGDFDTAATALDIADQRLRSLADPQLLPVRKLLVDEIDKLKSTNRVDIAGISLRLANMANTVEQLPLSLDFRAMKTKAENASEEKSKSKTPSHGFFQQLWMDIRSLITIRHNVESYKPLLPPKQQYFLRENLRLVLFGAQQAALRADSAAYRSNLEMAAHWIRTYFDTNAQAVKEMQTQIKTLEAAPLMAKRPDISASLSALRAIEQKRTGL